MTHTARHTPIHNQANLVDRFARVAVDQVCRLGPSPVHRALAAVRSEALAAALAPRRALAEAIGERIRAGDAGARAELAALAAEAFSAMRAEVASRARGTGAIAHMVARGDELWRDCETEELLDNPDLDLALRTGIMTTLDSFNDRFATYDRFLETMLPLCCRDRPTRVLDLAAGHGGFAIAAARAARRHGYDLHFTASDIKPEYLELGRAIAERESLPVAFVIQDAFDLTNLTAGSYDLIVSTQSLHHFPPGWVTVMFEAATRAAGRGVVFIDGCRSALAGASAIVYGTLWLRNSGWTHDAWVSTRKFFLPEELELLGRLGDPAGTIESRWLAPGHCLLRSAKPTRA